MKREKLALAALLAALSSFGIPAANAIPEAQVRAIRQTATDVPILELAPKAAEMVRKASAKDREDVAVTVVRAMVTRKPAMAPVIVGAIVKVAPDVSSAVAAAAAQLSPEQAFEIAREASMHAPADAHHVAAAVSRAVPEAAVRITKAAVAANPVEAPQIIEAVIFAVPTSKDRIQNDVTLNVVSALARSSRASASPLGTRITTQSKPIPDGFSPGTVATVASERLGPLVNALNSLKDLRTVAPAQSPISQSEASDVTVETLKTINLITRDQLTAKQDKETMLSGVIGSVTDIIGDDGLPSSLKGNAAKTIAQAIGVIATDADLSPAVKLIFVNFVSQEVRDAVLAGPQGQALGTLIAAIAGEVLKVVQAVQTITPAQALAALQQVEQILINQYGAP